MRRADTAARVWAVSLTGLLAAMVMAVWIRPLGLGPSLGKAVVAAILWVAATVLAGALGMGAAESFAEGRPRWPALRFLVGAAAAWVLLPPMLACWLRGSAWAAFFAACAAGVLAVCVWGMIPKAEAEEMWEPTDQGPRFADLPAPDSGRPQALAIAVCIELAIVLANRGDLFVATMLTGTAGFLLVWKRLSSLHAKAHDGAGRPAGRAAMATVLAMLILIPLLLLRLGPAHGGVETTAQAASRSRPDGEQGDAADEYQGIVLFTVQDKKKELPPLPVERDLLRAGMGKPLVIPFDGSYWYFQAPEHGPGLHPHLAHGDPVAVSIYSTGWVPLAMQAHQTLAQPVELRSSGAMRVTVKNGDNRMGRIDMGVLLTDSTAPGKPTMSLGIEPIVSTEAGNFRFKVNPVHEEVTYAIPAHGGVKKFDEITVFFFPDADRETLGARVGIEQFELTPGGRE
jgi:hypothetical protein